ncbi:TolB family protein [Methanolobus psychrotolerans]|uniref:TolB family protein n=1 Tax=Methanolobus psychrotolerans TaxID=1874706 RepID=UPI000B91741A|nr:TolB family protein [Methanolobus psychrotolerans]
MVKVNFALIIFALFVTITPVVANEIVELTDATESNGFPQWSHDGEKIAFVAITDVEDIGNTKINVMNSDGSNKAQLTSGKSLGWFFSLSGFGTANPWSSDGNRILYTSVLGLKIGDFAIPLKQNLCIINADGTGKEKLRGTSNAKSFEWVQNGTKIFMVDRSNRLWLLDPDGTDKELLASGDKNDSHFRCQPGGSKILYTSKGSDNYDLWLMNYDGSGKTQLTSAPDNEDEMAWSPDGKKIVYVSKSVRDKTNYSTYQSTTLNYSQTIWTMDADGTNKKQLTLSNRNWDSSPQWSPDGTKIAFQRMDVGTPFYIAIMNSDGSNLTVLTANDTTDISPQWSQKGDKITFMAYKNEKSTVSVILLDEELVSEPATNVTIMS